MSHLEDPRVPVTVVGIGAEGWAGLSPAARAAVRAASVIFGSRRQLAELPGPGDGPGPGDDEAPGSEGSGDGAESGSRLAPGVRRVEWPSPLLAALPRLLAEHGVSLAEEGGPTAADGNAGGVAAGGVAADGVAADGVGDAGVDGGGGSGGGVCVLASGDPMFYGIGVTLVRLLGARRVRVVPHPSSVSLACARLGWAVQDVDVVSAVGRPLDRVRLLLAPGRRLLVLSADRSTPGALASLLVDSGYGASPMTVLSRLGASDETRQAADARRWSAAAADLADVADLNIVAVRARPEADVAYRPRTPGLPDDAFEHDGQITKREIRALTLARLAPAPGELLWDVGAGSGSVAIEWLRAHESARAVALEPRADRAERIRRNAARLGVPHLRVVQGRAPQDLRGLPVPDAIFVGGGVSVPGVLDACWAALHGEGRARERGRLVVNAVTLESEAVLAGWYARGGGDLVRLAVSRASAVGGFTGWRPAMPVTQWTVWPAHARRAD
ncbi:Precorrin-6Y C(5,15)-methyltransferase (decarboxylating) [Frankia sp. AiPs1]|uniref:precorrin-6y C5,15-methyltransferase (decarboxylating) subunit CbiE n=1 Tax=Frankia sp. AiPa1 TaxID=573492 RepID=UPI00202B2806|nr:precorrin-6y C5,15-methyltransferase (decarboxylating) subunit CbiE [Frankia sp. AiPa1]MCL9760611.1 precorrin-6y C5,15-methyltransferase (decarboxylating) subunit CbiE [Frankia sp. AiPa1]